MFLLILYICPITISRIFWIYEGKDTIVHVVDLIFMVTIPKLGFIVDQDDDIIMTIDLETQGMKIEFKHLDCVVTCSIDKFEISYDGIQIKDAFVEIKKEGKSIASRNFPFGYSHDVMDAFSHNFSIDVGKDFESGLYNIQAAIKCSRFIIVWRRYLRSPPLRCENVRWRLRNLDAKPKMSLTEAIISKILPSTILEYITPRLQPRQLSNLMLYLIAWGVAVLLLVMTFGLAVGCKKSLRNSKRDSKSPKK